MNRKLNDYWIKSGFFALMKNLLTVVLSFGTFYFLVKLLDKHSFGAWCLFLGTTTLIEFARNGLVSNALIKFASAAVEEDKPKILTSAFAVTGILTLAGIVINCSIASWLSDAWNMPVVEQLFYFYNLIFVVTGCVNLFNCVQQANLQFKGTFLSSLVGPLINFIYVVAAWIMGYDISLLSLLYMYLLGSIISFAIAYFNAKAELIFSRLHQRLLARRR